MKSINIKNPEEFKKELRDLDFINLKFVQEDYFVYCNCDDWFARFLKDNLIAKYDSEYKNFIFIEKINHEYIELNDFIKLLEVIKKHGE